MAASLVNDSELRREIDQLGRLFGDVIREFAGVKNYELVEQVRGLAGAFRDGNLASGDELRDLLASLNESQLSVVIRAFTLFLELANLAEDRQRVRVLRERERRTHPEPRPESIRAAVNHYREIGLAESDVEQLIARVDVDLVLTAHPTEAKRRSLRHKTRRICELLGQLDMKNLLPRESDELWGAIRGEMVKLWQTDFIRSTRPTVLDEAQRGLAILPVLWETAPRIYRELREAMSEYYPEATKVPIRPLRFGSWIGGDRDGHPFVTPEITAQVFSWMRSAALEAHLETCLRLQDSLSFSARKTSPPKILEEAIRACRARWPAVSERLKVARAIEPFRDWLKVIQWRLEQTGFTTLAENPREGAYRAAEELKFDVRVLAEALDESGNLAVCRMEVEPWLVRIDAFGMQTARLDIRQHTSVYRQVMEELFSVMGRSANPAALSEEEFEKLVLETLENPPSLPVWRISPSSAETLALFSVIRRVARRFGMEAIGGHVLSMTHKPSDLFTLLWLWNWSEHVDGGHPDDAALRLAIIPLFETIDDLKHGAGILDESLSAPAFRDYIRQQGDRMLVMLGYSDSTKDGGYLAAIWELQRAQIELYRMAAKHGVEVTFFHGRGGSLGRGGGPAGRSIRSLPHEAFFGALRLTEQGEVLAERYDDPQIAHRHLEQVVSSVLLAIAGEPDPDLPQWHLAMLSLADSAYEAYRELVELEGFPEFFRLATPIRAIEELPIGSRPAKRKAGNSLNDLRAIPWVFSWTQCRSLLPAWYGMGSAIERQLEAGTVKIEELRIMYRQWPFLRAAIDNAVLALAKSNMVVFREYVGLAKDVPGGAVIADRISQEFDRTKQYLLAIVDEQELLDGIPWLKRSIQVRNGYVDPLNFVQVELLRRAAVTPQETDLHRVEERWHLTSLTVQGIAAGMRTTG